MDVTQLILWLFIFLAMVFVIAAPKIRNALPRMKSRSVVRMIQKNTSHRWTAEELETCVKRLDAALGEYLSGKTDSLSPESFSSSVTGDAESIRATRKKRGITLWSDAGEILFEKAPEQSANSAFRFFADTGHFRFLLRDPEGKGKNFSGEGRLFAESVSATAEQRFNLTSPHAESCQSAAVSAALNAIRQSDDPKEYSGLQTISRQAAFASAVPADDYTDRVIITVSYALRGTKRSSKHGEEYDLTRDYSVTLLADSRPDAEDPVRAESVTLLAHSENRHHEPVDND